MVLSSLLLRYGGSVLPFSNEKTPNKSKKVSPRKKNSGVDMVTAPSKNIVRRKPKIKSSGDIADTIVNGVNSTKKTWNHTELNPFLEKFKSPKFNNLNSASKSEIHSLESVNNFITRLSRDADPNLNHLRLTGISKYADIVNHTRHPEQTSDSAIYSRTSQPTANEYEIKPNVDNPLARKLNNNVSTSKTKKTEDFPIKNAELLNLLPNYSTKLIKNSSAFDGFPPIPDAQTVDCRKYVDNESEKPTPEPVISKICENKLFLRAKRKKHSRSKWRMDSGTRHEALQRIAEGFEKQVHLQNDLFPLSELNNCNSPKITFGKSPPPCLL